jgi:hypothetical protein
MRYFTSRAIAWATDALAYDNTTVPALARHLRVNWHTPWRAIKKPCPFTSPAQPIARFCTKA